MLKILLKLTLISLIIPLVFSCVFSEDKSVPVLTVVYTDFEDAITIEGLIEPVHSTTMACPRNIEGTVTYIVEDGSFVEEGEIVCQIEVPELQTEYDKLLIDLENAEANLTKTIADLEMQYALVEAQVKSNDAETLIAQLDSLQLKYAPPNQRKIKELELEKVLIDKQKHEKKLKALNVIQQSEVKKLELSIQRLKNRIKTTKEQIDALTLKAPKKGLAVKGYHFITWTKIQVGDIVWSNMPLITLPQLTEMRAKIQATEKDFKFINVGDSVFYTFDAMPENKGWGKITKKAPVGKPIKQNSKIKYFEIDASIDSVLVTPEIGISAECRIVMKQLEDTIVIPQISIFDVDSMKVVYVKKDNGFQLRQVLTGVSSSKETVITSGLKSDEAIALIKPDASLIKDRVVLPDSTTQQINKVEEK
ncbi:efflux RND transporter periplasmic adaptor subunit [Dysgonomonas sp. 216]|uniref:efflux RND transporter periplasmic adaptor subunit n=1 Tax=Dysgonomonas sp. 216 TaxID=2302934 RepID=UPI0013D12AA9